MENDHKNPIYDTHRFLSRDDEGIVRSASAEAARCSHLFAFLLFVGISVVWYALAKHFLPHEISKF